MSKPILNAVHDRNVRELEKLLILSRYCGESLHRYPNENAVCNYQNSLLLAAVGGTGRQASVALAADLLVAVVLLGEHAERRLDDT